MRQGWIKLHRSIINSSLFAMRPEDLKVAIALMELVNFEPKEWHNKWEHRRITVGRGEYITSYPNLAEICRLSVQTVRTSIKHLVEDGFVEILNYGEKSTRNFTHIRICKYDTYQSEDFESNAPSTGNQQAVNAPSTGNQQQLKNEKNLKNGKKEKNTFASQNKFATKLGAAHVSKF